MMLIWLKFWALASFYLSKDTAPPLFGWIILASLEVLRFSPFWIVSQVQDQLLPCTEAITFRIQAAITIGTWCKQIWHDEVIGLSLLHWTCMWLPTWITSNISSINYLTIGPLSYCTNPLTTSTYLQWKRGSQTFVFLLRHCHSCSIFNSMT